MWCVTTPRFTGGHRGIDGRVAAPPLQRNSGGGLELFHDLSGLALPLESYESLTSPVRVRLAAMGAARRLTRGDTRDLYLPMVEAELAISRRARSRLPNVMR